MKLFRRNKQTVDMPPEVAEYYQAERRDRRGVTILLTFLALCVTVAVIVGLFLAGRWVYRTIQGDSQDNTSQTADMNTAEEQRGTEGSDTANGADTNTDSNSGNGSGAPQNDENVDQNPTTDNNRTDGTADNGNDNSTDTSDTSGEATDSTGGAGSTQDRGAAGSSDNLTNTGPGETAIAAFAGGSIVGYVLYRRRLLQTDK